MSKSQKRSNREKKKPKQEKPKVSATATSQGSLQFKAGGFHNGKKT